jgi:peptidyl-dipeptidase A
MFAVLPLLLLASCSKGPTAKEAHLFVDEAETRLLRLSNEAGRANWVQSTYITVDTEALAAQANERLIQAGVELAKEAARYDNLELPPDLARKLKLLKNSLTLAAPADPRESEEVTQIATRMEGVYGRGKYCREGVPADQEPCLNILDITRTMANSRNAAELADVWRGWRTVSPPMRQDYARFVELANKGARELGFADSGTMWRSKYDMEPDAFAKELDRLWEQVRPLYVSLHAYVRNRLRQTPASI